ncbi:hypothetical protein FKM82_017820 [Ascaphus truei]
MLLSKTWKLQLCTSILLGLFLFFRTNCVPFLLNLVTYISNTCRTLCDLQEDFRF